MAAAPIKCFIRDINQVYEAMPQASIWIEGCVVHKDSSSLVLDDGTGIVQVTCSEKSLKRDEMFRKQWLLAQECGKWLMMTCKFRSGSHVEIKYLRLWIENDDEGDGRMRCIQWPLEVLDAMLPEN